MLVNKFRVLTRSLETTSLSRAVMTFRVCCVLHNFIIDERLRTTGGHIDNTITPNGDRLIQIPSPITDSDVLFAEVPRVFPGHDLESAMQSMDMLTDIKSHGDEFESETAPTRYDMVERIEASGYIRPRPYGQRLQSYICVCCFRYSYSHWCWHWHWYGYGYVCLHW